MELDNKYDKDEQESFLRYSVSVNGEKIDAVSFNEEWVYGIPKGASAFFMNIAFSNYTKPDPNNLVVSSDYQEGDFYSGFAGLYWEDQENHEYYPTTPDDIVFKNVPFKIPKSEIFNFKTIQVQEDNYYSSQWGKGSITLYPFNYIVCEGSPAVITIQFNDTMGFGSNKFKADLNGLQITYNGNKSIGQRLLSNDVYAIQFIKTVASLNKDGDCEEGIENGASGDRPIGIIRIILRNKDGTYSSTTSEYEYGNFTEVDFSLGVTIETY